MKRIRVVEESAVYHCIGRIVGGAMMLGDREKEMFRRMMWRLADFCGVEVITYCVMTNHVHLLVRISNDIEVTDEELCRRVTKLYGRKEPWVQMMLRDFEKNGAVSKALRESMLSRMGNVSRFMQSLKQRFSKWYNKSHGRFGTLWAERFKSVLVEGSAAALQTVAMYIDLNPVRAGMVKDPKDYRFCGHAEAVAGNRAARKGILDACRAANWREASGEYRCAMMVFAGDSSRPDKVALKREEVMQTLKRGGQVELAELLRLRLRYLTDGVVFGSKEFVEKVFEKFRDRFGSGRKSGARRLHGLGSNLSAFAAARDVRKAAVS